MCPVSRKIKRRSPRSLRVKNPPRSRTEMEEAEREKRKKNIVISRLKINDKKELESWIERKTGVKVDIRKLWVIKKIRNVIGAQIENMEQKIELMKNKNKLKQEKDKICT